MSVDLITERGLPHSLDAERCVLGSIILENDSLYQVVDLLGADDFYAENHRILYERFVELITKSRGVDLIILKEELSRLSELEQVGGITYIASLIDAVPTARNITHYAQIIKERAALRRLILAGYEIIDSCYKQEEETEDILNRAEQRIFSIAQKRLTSGFVPFKEIADDVWNKINQLHENPGQVTGVATGFADFDKLTSGLQPTDFVIIAGRPSMGKTALALNIAQSAATTANKTVGVFSLEMSKEQLGMRFVCSEARVNFHRLRSGETTREDWTKLMKAMATLADAKIFIDDSSGLTPLDMSAKARRLKAEYGCDLLIVDYLQMMRMRSRTENRQQEISAISRSLKELAKELYLPVIALSQLSRGPELRTDHEPQLADLRESGSIEQDADLVCFIYREEVYSPEDETVKGLAELMVKKHRNGPLQNIPLVFLKEWTRFENRYE
jgi:replicative DNA helicase